MQTHAFMTPPAHTIWEMVQYIRKLSKHAIGVAYCNVAKLHVIRVLLFSIH